jgi:DNA-binding LacI/PurR family transcriptional regulator
MHSQSRKRVTLYDVAENAGVSHQTVSRIVNGSENVTEATRAKVLKVIAELGYRPNRLAKGLATGKSHVIQVVSFNYTFLQPLGPMVDHAAGLGYDIAISFHDPKSGRSGCQDILNELQSRWIDGAIVMEPMPDFPYDELRSHTECMPVIFLGSVPHVSSIPSVILNQEMGVQLALDHLLSRGHTRIAEISGPLTHHEGARRHAMFQRHLGERGLETGLFFEGDFSPESGRQGMEALWRRDPSFTAVFAACDRAALGVMNACYELGVSVPDGLSVVGFDDDPEARYFTPPLTTVRQNFAALGRESVDYLVSLIGDRGTPLQQRTLFPELVARGSVAAPRA